MAMNKKQQEEIGKALGALIGFVLFIPFIVFGFLHYKKLEAKYLIDENCHRVMDIGNLFSSLFIPASFSVAVAFVVFVVYENGMILLAAAVALLGCFALIIMSKYVAAHYLNVIINRQNKTVCFPMDMESYGLSDLFSFKFLKDCTEMDVVNTEDIERITRQSGKHLYIHGSFGSRRLTFSSKQKRDECMVAIQSVSDEKIKEQFELEYT
jgi:hypothetical protein